jgi:hypothetical protein
MSVLTLRKPVSPGVVMSTAKAPATDPTITIPVLVVAENYGDGDHGPARSVASSKVPEWLRPITPTRFTDLHCVPFETLAFICLQ